jgi:hypothetical protein
MILPCIYIGCTKEMGRGIFTSANLTSETIIEVSPVIVMKQKERKLIDATILHDYIFEWGIKSRQCCLALGYVSLYNHSYSSNCEYDMDYKEESISIKTIRAIHKGEELFINYNGTWNNNKSLWFEAK